MALTLRRMARHEDAERINVLCERFEEAETVAHYAHHIVDLSKFGSVSLVLVILALYEIAVDA